MSEPPYRAGLPALFDVVHRLRSPGGCPWDREQTHASLRPYLLEEAYEAVEAIDSGDGGKLMEELGDLLLQVAMHAEIAAESARFDAAQVSESAAAKMVARHPHVFGDAVATDAEQVLHNWERRKAEEALAAGRPEESVFERVPRALPALAWTLALQERAARLGWEGLVESDGNALAERARQLGPEREPEELFEEFGDLLLSAVALGRRLGIDPEDALRVAGQRFIQQAKAREYQTDQPPPTAY